MSPQRDYYGRPGEGWTGQTRTRGFSPFFRGLYPDYSDQHLRVSDAERQTVTDRLAQHFADGRLDQAEFDERVGQAMNAKTRADLNGLFSDLPETGAPAVTDYRQRRRGHPILLIILLIIAASAAAHVLWWFAVPAVWLVILVVAVMLATRTFGRPRARQDQ